MINLWFLLFFSNILAWLTIVPFVDKNLSPFDRFSRMKCVHRIFSAREKIFSFLHLKSSKVNADVVALNEIISLYHPTIKMNNGPNDKNIEQLRYNMNQILVSLLPTRTSSCIIENETIDYDQGHVKINFIRNSRLNHWKSADRPFILYLHGGGFLYGDNETYFGYECSLSDQLNMIVIHVDYGLLPQQSLTKILDEIMIVYKFLLKFHVNLDQRLIGIGDSSGGLIWIHLLQQLIKENQKLPRAVVLNSPWTNFQLKKFDWSLNQNDLINIEMAFFLRSVTIFDSQGSFKLTNEEKYEINPISDKFERFPPIYISVGTSDIFFHEIQIMARKIRRTGAEIFVDISHGSMHNFALFHLWTDDARCVQKRFSRWINQRLNQPWEISWQNSFLPISDCKS